MPDNITPPTSRELEKQLMEARKREESEKYEASARLKDLVVFDSNNEVRKLFISDRINCLRRDIDTLIRQNEELQKWEIVELLVIIIGASFGIASAVKYLFSL